MQRIGFIGNGVVEEPNKIVRQSRGWEQQETTSIPRAGGLKGRIHVFKTPPVNWVLSIGRWSHRDTAAVRAAAHDREKKGEATCSPSLYPPVLHHCISLVRCKWSQLTPEPAGLRFFPTDQRREGQEMDQWGQTGLGPTCSFYFQL